MFKSSRIDQSTTYKNVSQESFFCLGKNVYRYEVIGVQYTALCENEKNEKNQHPDPAQQECHGVPVDDAIKYHRLSPAKHFTAAVHHQSHQHKIKDNRPATLRTPVSIIAGFEGFARVIKLPKPCPGA